MIGHRPMGQVIEFRAEWRMMKRTATIIAIVLAVTLGAAGQRRGSKGTAPESEQNPPLAKTESEKRILATMNEVVKAGELYANVPAVDGRMLRLLTEAVNAKDVIEIGASTGISGMWFCMALEKTGGKLTTFELDPGRAALVRAHFKKAAWRLVGIVTAICLPVVAAIRSCETLSSDSGLRIQCEQP